MSDKPTHDGDPLKPSSSRQPRFEWPATPPPGPDRSADTTTAPLPATHAAVKPSSPPRPRFEWPTPLPADPDRSPEESKAVAPATHDDEEFGWARFEKRYTPLPDQSGVSESETSMGRPSPNRSRLREESSPSGRVTRARKTSQATPVQDRAPWLVAGAIGVGLGCALVALGVSDAPTPTPPPPPTAAAAPSPVVEASTSVPGVAALAALAQATKDDLGRDTRIVGGNPDSVLAAYCEAGKYTDPMEPIGIRRAAVHQLGLRVGVLRRQHDPAREYAIWIRMNPRTGKWFVGNGETPVIAQELGDAPH